MGEQSRIKFNPVTQEIEIEGSEQFIKTYFDKIQAMLLGTQEAVVKVPIKKKSMKTVKEILVKEKALKEKAIKEKPAKKPRKLKKAAEAAKGEVPAKEVKKGSKSNTVLTLIQESPDGITTTELEEKTGFKDRQIWAIISHAKKIGKIKQEKRGVYVGA
jgi:hypothetical protein